MRRFALAGIILLSADTFASNFYVDVGAGGFISNSTSSYVSDSTSALYTPTAPGSSLFILPNVNWKNSFDNGVNASLAAGYRFTPNWRSEIEFFFQHMNRDISGSYNWKETNSSTLAVYATSNNNPITHTSTGANVYSFLTNGYYDIPNHTKWTPFVGVGLGLAWMNSNNTNSTNTLNVDDPLTPLIETAPVAIHSPSLYGTALAWQLKLGVTYEWQDGKSLKLLYRLFGTSQFKSGNSWITSNPGATGETQFNVSSHDVSGILTNALELHYAFNI